jgi:1,4-alpha-glucan branching enzyme
MPYVIGGGPWPVTAAEPQGFGTWPFGEEWLWEAVATSYLPLLDTLGRAPITLSLTPVLADQLEDGAALERCLAFLREVRPQSHRLDAARYAGEPELAQEIARSQAEYAAAAERLASLPGGLLGALGEHVTWTSAATHAILPMLASDTAISLQVNTGIAAYRARFGTWSGGFWLPECAYAPWLDGLLADAGVRATCVELTRHWPAGDERHLRALVSDEGPVLWPLDRSVIDLVWGAEGYPSAPAYRNYHGLTDHHHRLWRNDGAPYDHLAARSQAAADARAFVAAVRDRLATGGVCVCALDTELLGHWWYEGPWWLAEVIEEAARQRLELTTLDDALERHEPAALEGSLGVSSWGEGGDLRTWSGPAVAELAWRARTAELAMLASGQRPSDRALRELLALQSSDWAFLSSRELAGEYPRERFNWHASALERAVAGADPGRPEPVALAPRLAGWLA